MPQVTPLSTIARLCAAAAAAIAATVLAGWIFGSAGPGSLWMAKPMQPVSALCFLMAGCAIASRSVAPGPWATAGTWAAALAIALLAADGVLDALWGSGLGAAALVNRLADVHHALHTLPNRNFALPRSLPFLLISAALASLGLRRRPSFDAATWGGIGIASLALHILVGYVTVFASMAEVRIAASTATGFLLLGIALVLSRPDPMLATAFLRGSASSIASRRLLLGGLLVPPLIFAAQERWLAGNGAEVHAPYVFFAASYATAFLGIVVTMLRRIQFIDLQHAESEQARDALLAQVQQQAATLQSEVSERTFELRESRERLELALQSSACGVWDWDPATGRVDWNERQCTIYGLRPDQFDGRLETWASLVHPEDRPQAVAAMHRELKTAEQFHNSYRIVTHTGAVRYIAAYAFARRDARGNCIRVVGVDRDATQVRESERAILALAERLQFALGSAGYGVWELDCKTERITWDDRMLEINGVRREDFRGTVDELPKWMHPEDRPTVSAAFADVREGRLDHFEIRFRIVRPDRSTRTIETRCFLQRAADRSPLRVIGLTRDVTKEAELHERLRIAEERWQLALSSNNDGLWDWNSLTNELYFDERWAAMIGYGPGEVTYHYSEWETRVHPDDLEATEAAIEAHFSGQTPFYVSAYRLRHKLGQWIWILDRGKIVSRDSRGRPARVVGTHTDITESKALENRLRTFEETALQMGRLAQIGPWDLNIADHRLTWSPEVYRIHHADLGFEPSLEGMLGFYELESQARLREAFERAIRMGTPFDLELPVLTKGGGTKFVRFLGKAEAKDGVTAHLYGAVQDITEIRESENARRRLETQLFQAQKMETLGTLAGGIAHDFNNLLTGILSYQELALEDIAEDHPAHICLVSARGVSIRARELVEQILTLSRRPSNEMVSVDLSLVIEDARRFLKTTVPANIVIETEIAPGCGRVLAKPSQIHQVLLNLVQNSVHAIGSEGGTVRISLAPETLHRHEAEPLGLIEPGDYLKLTVSDTGHGMDAETQKRIFDPFFTTKGVGQGTGLGLSVVHGIVLAHRGAITVESAPGKGTVFTIHLVYAEGIDREPVDGGSDDPRGSGELVCVVDDEDFVLLSVGKVIERLGYRTVTFNSPQGLLDGLRGEQSGCRLLITDQTMPGMTGIEVAKAARSLAPTLPIIIMSGYFSKIAPAILKDLNGVTLVSKPFTASELASAVHHALHPSENSPSPSHLLKEPQN